MVGGMGELDLMDENMAVYLVKSKLNNQEIEKKAPAIQLAFQNISIFILYLDF